MKNSPVVIRKSTQVREHYDIPKKFHVFIRLPTAKSGKFLGRTGKSWALIFTFYLVFFFMVSLIFGIHLMVMYKYMPLGAPKYFLDQPGLMFAPSCQEIAKFPNIKYNEKSNIDIECLTNAIDKFLAKYGNMRTFGDCSPQNSYGYANRTPCIFLKLNRLIHFHLKPIEEAGDLPSEAPDELRAHIAALPPEERKQRAWLSCEGNHIAAPKYFLSHGVPAAALKISNDGLHDSDSKDFYNDKDFQRIVAVQLISMPVNRNVKIKCFAWAKNIEQRTDLRIAYGQGYVQFDMNIENK